MRREPLQSVHLTKHIDLCPEREREREKERKKERKKDRERARERERERETCVHLPVPTRVHCCACLSKFEPVWCARVRVCVYICVDV